MTEPFKTCPLCAKVWTSRRELLTDPDIELVGYQVDFEELALGLFLFNHNTCQTTLSVRAGRLKDLYLGPVFRERKTGQQECQGYCLRRSALGPCPAECECAWVRVLLQIIRNWPKSETEARAADGALPAALPDGYCRKADGAC
jgi:hypothetical protein